MIKHAKDVLKERKSQIRPTTLQKGSDDFEEWLHEDSLKITQNSKTSPKLGRAKKYY